MNKRCEKNFSEFFLSIRDQKWLFSGIWYPGYPIPRKNPCLRKIPIRKNSRYWRFSRIPNPDPDRRDSKSPVIFDLAQNEKFPSPENCIPKWKTRMSMMICDEILSKFYLLIRNFSSEYGVHFLQFKAWLEWYFGLVLYNRRCRLFWPEATAASQNPRPAPSNS